MRNLRNNSPVKYDPREQLLEQDRVR